MTLIKAAAALALLVMALAGFALGYALTGIASGMPRRSGSDTGTRRNVRRLTRRG